LTARRDSNEDGLLTEYVFVDLGDRPVGISSTGAAGAQKQAEAGRRLFVLAERQYEPRSACGSGLTIGRAGDDRADFFPDLLQHPIGRENADRDVAVPFSAVGAIWMVSALATT